MKKHIHRTFSILLAVLSIIIGFISCDDGSRNNNESIVPQALLGRWNEEIVKSSIFPSDGGIITISQGSISKTWNDGYYTATITNIVPVSNTITDGNVNINYPNGYKLTGTCTSHWFSTNVGKQNVDYIFLSVDEKKFWTDSEARNALPPPYNVYVKQ